MPSVHDKSLWVIVMIWSRWGQLIIWIPQWHGHILRWHCQDSSTRVKECFRELRHNFHTWTGHHRVQTLTPPLRIISDLPEETLRSGLTSIINMRSWREINATLDRNKCCKIAWAYRNNARVKGSPIKY